MQNLVATGIVWEDAEEIVQILVKEDVGALAKGVAEVLRDRLIEFCK